MVNNTVSAIKVSKEQKRRIKGVLLYQEIWEKIQSCREQIELCNKAVFPLNTFVDQLIDEDKDIPALIGKTISVLRQKKETAEYGMKKGHDNLQNIFPFLNGEFVKGWGSKDPFTPPFDTTEKLMSLVLNGDTIDKSVLPK